MNNLNDAPDHPVNN